MSLLLRLYQPQKGNILLDGRPIEDYDVRYLRSRMVIVDQHTVLFRMTIRENITYGLARDMSDEDIQRSCDDACAWDFIQEKPDKLMTDITTGGSNLSGGQRQRVAIARAMVRRPDIILLDEATSALDVKNEKIVQKALDQLAKQGSALVIAHRLSTIRDSDEIVVIDKGADIERGTHEDLVKKPVEPTHDAPHQGGPSPGGPRTLRRSVSSSAPASRVSLARAGSSPQLTSAHGAGEQDASELITYRSLWDASTKGKEDAMNLRQIQEKMDLLREELSSLEVRSTSIKDHLARALPSINGHASRAR